MVWKHRLHSETLETAPGADALTLQRRNTDKGELENPNAGEVDWGLSCIHYISGKKKKKKLDIVLPSSPVGRAAVRGDTRGPISWPRGGGPRWVRISQALRLSSSFLQWDQAL